VLIMLALYTLDLQIRHFLRAVMGVPLCILAGGVLGEVVYHFTRRLPAILHIAVTSGVMVLVVGLLLAYTQGLSIRGAMRSLKGGAPPPPPPDQGTSKADTQT
jgi:cation transporter-like permease